MKYPRIMQALHWIMGISIIGMLAVGLYMEDLPKEDPSKYEIYAIHKAVGIILLSLLVLRLIVRRLSVLPPLPETFRAIERKAAFVGHALLYTLMLAMPVSGFVMSQMGGHPVSVFGLEIPMLFDKNDAGSEMASVFHAVFGKLFIVVIAIHVLAVVKHYRVDKINLLKRMGL